MTVQVCNIMVCDKPATHEGTLSVVGSKSKFTLTVAYCDAHVFSQQRVTGPKLDLDLEKIRK